MKNTLIRLKIFIKQYKIIAISLLVSFFVLIRESDVPLLYESTVLRLLFVPCCEVFSGFLINIVVSYIAAVVFFYVVNFYSEWKQNIKAKKILDPFTRNLYCYISHLVGFINLEMELQGTDDPNKLMFAPKMDIYYEYCMGNREPSFTKVDFNHGCVHYSGMIMNELKRMFIVPIVDSLDESIVIDLSQLYANSCLAYSMSKEIDMENTHIEGFGSLYKLLCKTRDDLSVCYKYEQYAFGLLDKDGIYEYKSLLQKYKDSLILGSFIYVNGYELRKD